MTFVTGRSIAVDGLADTIRGLKATHQNVGRVASAANRKLTKRIIIPEVESNWRSQRVKPSVAASVVKEAGGENWAGVRVYLKKYPYAAGVQFGSLKYGQFRKWVGNAATGSDGDYLVDPAVRRKGDDFARLFMDEVTRAVVEEIVT